MLLLKRSHHAVENIYNLKNEIQKKREEMILVGIKEGLCSEKTLQLSSELDRLIQIYQQKTTSLL